MREGDGALLVFLTGWDEISKLLERLKANPVLRDGSKCLLLPLHGSMPTINQREIFQRPPPGMRYAYIHVRGGVLHEHVWLVAGDLMNVCDL